MKATHETIYHYTSLATLKEILSTGRLRFTDFRYLNDESEFRLALSPDVPFARALHQKLLNCPFSNRPEHPLLDGEHRFLADYRKFLAEVAFLGVACLSGERDSLSQWRAYCPSSSGVAIGFNYRRLFSFAAQHQLSLTQCNYVDPNDESTFSHLIDSLHNDLLNWRDRNPSAEYYIKCLAGNFGSLKDSTFRAEQEYRLISPALKHNQVSIETDAGAALDVELQFRPGSHCLIPFIDIPKYTTTQIPTVTTPTTLLGALDEIVIGPTFRPELSCRSVTMLMKMHQMEHVAISRTTVPLRYM